MSVLIRKLSAGEQEGAIPALVFLGSVQVGVRLAERTLSTLLARVPRHRSHFPSLPLFFEQSPRRQNTGPFCMLVVLPVKHEAAPYLVTHQR